MGAPGIVGRISVEGGPAILQTFKALGDTARGAFSQIQSGVQAVGKGISAIGHAFSGSGKDFGQMKEKAVSAVSGTTTALKDGAKAVTAQTRNMAADVESGVFSATVKLKALGLAAKGIALAYSAATGDAASAASAGAKATGLSVERFQLLASAAKRSGIDVEQFTELYSKFIVAVGKAKSGEQEKLAGFNAFGISKADLDASRDALPLFMKVADAYSGMSGDLTRRAYGFDKLLGDEGRALGPLLDKGSASINTLGEQARAAGTVVSQATVDQNKSYKLAIGNVGEYIEGLKIQLGSKILPYLSAFAGQVSQAVEKSMARFGGVQTIINKIFGGGPAASSEMQSMMDDRRAWAMEQIKSGYFKTNAEADAFLRSNFGFGLEKDLPSWLQKGIKKATAVFNDLVRILTGSKEKRETGFGIALDEIYKIARTAFDYISKKGAEVRHFIEDIYDLVGGKVVKSTGTERFIAGAISTAISAFGRIKGYLVSGISSLSKDVGAAWHKLFNGDGIFGAVRAFGEPAGDGDGLKGSKGGAGMSANRVGPSGGILGGIDSAAKGIKSLYEENLKPIFEGNAPKFFVELRSSIDGFFARVGEAFPAINEAYTRYLQPILYGNFSTAGKNLFGDIASGAVSAKTAFEDWVRQFPELDQAYQKYLKPMLEGNWKLAFGNLLDGAKSIATTFEGIVHSVIEAKKAIDEFMTWTKENNFATGYRYIRDQGIGSALNMFSSNDEQNVSRELGKSGLPNRADGGRSAPPVNIYLDGDKHDLSKPGEADRLAASAAKKAARQATPAAFWLIGS